MPATQADRDRLWDLIKDIRYAMFTTRDGNGQLHSRPMTVQNKRIDEDNLLWFFMGRAGEPVDDIGRDPRVNVVFADPDDNAYVSISGQAAVVDDPQRARELWSNMAQAWFPGGPEDPALALVKVGITHADYWDVKDNKLVQVFKMVKAAATGQPPKDMADHGRVRMG